jgi:hypothetical protein
VAVVVVWDSGAAVVVSVTNAPAPTCATTSSCSTACSGGCVASQVADGADWLADSVSARARARDEEMLPALVLVLVWVVS